MAISKLIEIILKGKDDTGPAMSAASKRLDGLSERAKSANAQFVKTWDLGGGKLAPANASANKSMLDMALSAGKAGLAIGSAAAIVYKATETAYRFADSQATIGDELNDLSLRTGLAVEDLSALDYALKLNGGSTHDLETGVRTLAARMNDARNGSAEMVDDFKRLGVSAAQLVNGDGSLKSIDEILPMIADGLKNLSSQSERMDLAQAMFGRGGLKLLPTLQQGSEGIAQMREELERLGGAMSTDFAQASDGFKDAQAKMATAMQRFNESLSSPLIGSFTGLVDLASKAVGALAGKLNEAERAYARVVAGATKYKDQVSLDSVNERIGMTESEIAAIEARRTVGIGQSGGLRNGDMDRLKTLREELKALQEARYEIEVAVNDAFMATIGTDRPERSSRLAELIAMDEAAESLTAQLAKATEASQRFFEGEGKRKATDAAPDLTFYGPGDGSLEDVGGMGAAYEAALPSLLMLVEGQDDLWRGMEGVRDAAFAYEERLTAASGIIQSSMVSAFDVVNLKGKKVANEIAGAFISALSRIAAEWAAASFLSLLGLPAGGPFALLGKAAGATGAKSSGGGANGLIDAGGMISAANARYSRGYI